jgi:GH15 family glucan-1,4-alpha-glucosidase
VSPPSPHVLREYALIADGERGALVGPQGDVAWLCFPGWADPAVFASLLGGGGWYAVTPAGRFVWGGSYEPGTLIWRSRWTAGDAIVECREALAFPGDRDRAVLLRRIQGLQGTARMIVTCELAGDYGRRAATDVHLTAGGVWEGRAGDAAFRWSGAGDARPDAHGVLRLELEVAAGDEHDLVLVLGAPSDTRRVDPDRAWDATTAAWRAACPPPASAVAERDAHHARAVLRGLTSGTGGMVAAATMSLPERAGAGRNYDYRYAWLRDQALAGQAAARAGATDLLDTSVAFLRERLLDDGDGVAPAYTVGGGRMPDERSLGLPGYPGGSDVAGNRANAQFQLDAFGEALLLFAAAARHDRLDADTVAAAQTAAAAIARRADEQDAGIWELDPARWTHSRLICAAGLRAAAPLLQAADEQLALADALVAGAPVHPSGRWQRAEGDPRVDAALLFAGLRGATPPDDPRVLATLDAVLHELTEDLYVYRYRPDDRPLGEAEGAFLLCGLLASLALAQQGRAIEAMRFFERNRAACGPPGLLTEEFDVRQRQLRGNLPQAFVHALLLECAATAGHSQSALPVEVESS